MARCHNSAAAFATRWSHSQRSQAPRQSQTPEKIGVKLHRSIGGQPERGGDKIGVNSCYMLYYIISILYDIILYYIMLLYIITCDAAGPSSNTQESNSLSPLTCEYAAFALQPSDSRAPLDHLLYDQLAQPDRDGVVFFYCFSHGSASI